MATPTLEPATMFKSRFSDVTAILPGQRWSEQTSESARGGVKDLLELNSVQRSTFERSTNMYLNLSFEVLTMEIWSKTNRQGMELLSELVAETIGGVHYTPTVKPTKDDFHGYAAYRLAGNLGPSKNTASPAIEYIFIRERENTIYRVSVRTLPFDKMLPTERKWEPNGKAAAEAILASVSLLR